MRVTPSFAVTLLAWVPAFILSATILALSLYKIFNDIALETPRFWTFDSWNIHPLFLAIIREGIIFYVVNTVVTLVNALLVLRVHNPLDTIAMPLMIAAYSFCGCRFLLNFYEIVNRDWLTPSREFDEDIVIDDNLTGAFMLNPLYHSGASPPSVQALKLLQDAKSRPYPPSSGKQLDFNLEVVNDPPTPDQLSIILNYTKQSVGSLLSVHPASSTTFPDQPSSIKALHTVFTNNPKAMKWPVVVNWDDGQAAVGDVDGVKGILESLRRKRDGEEPGGGSEIDTPKGWFS
ncbi:hypothetical protein Clacol_008268 [Clathrus columnatus]|uniref:Uncharacterized protein n=1 Tax=Clathrus columnatus TaxID=1419009 RepID=A0AAV5AH88_9AGAM|nr:hypothetical protein Clacol_008268 [Clathrus columnatus]